MLIAVGWTMTELISDDFTDYAEADGENLHVYPKKGMDNNLSNTSVVVANRFEELDKQNPFMPGEIKYLPVRAAPFVAASGKIETKSVAGIVTPFNAMAFNRKELLFDIFWGGDKSRMVAFESDDGIQIRKVNVGMASMSSMAMSQFILFTRLANTALSNAAIFSAVSFIKFKQNRFDSERWSEEPLKYTLQSAEKYRRLLVGKCQNRGINSYSISHTAKFEKGGNINFCAESKFNRNEYMDEPGVVTNVWNQENGFAVRYSGGKANTYSLYTDVCKRGFGITGKFDDEAKKGNKPASFYACYVINGEYVMRLVNFKDIEIPGTRRSERRGEGRRRRSKTPPRPKKKSELEYKYNKNNLFFVVEEAEGRFEAYEVCDLRIVGDTIAAIIAF